MQTETNESNCMANGYYNHMEGKEGREERREEGKGLPGRTRKKYRTAS